MGLRRRAAFLSCEKVDMNRLLVGCGERVRSGQVEGCFGLWLRACKYKEHKALGQILILWFTCDMTFGKLFSLTAYIKLHVLSTCPMEWL